MEVLTPRPPNSILVGSLPVVLGSAPSLSIPGLFQNTEDLLMSLADVFLPVSCKPLPLLDHITSSALSPPEGSYPSLVTAPGAQPGLELAATAGGCDSLVPCCGSLLDFKPDSVMIEEEAEGMGFPEASATIVSAIDGFKLVSATDGVALVSAISEGPSLRSVG